LPDPYYGESDDFEKVLDLVEKQALQLVSAWARATE
jgi:protein-tyrosine-phosphatase